MLQYIQQYSLSFLAAILVLTLVSATLPHFNMSTQLKVTISNIQQAKGHIRVAIYNAEKNFLDEKNFYSAQSVAVNGGETLTVEFMLPYGDYAITTYHDLNSNQSLDKNTLGIPNEPYAISRSNGKWRKPRFGESKMTFNQPNTTVNLVLKRWGER